MNIIRLIFVRLSVFSVCLSACLNTNLFGQDMNANGIFFWISPEINLCENLIGE